MATLQIAEDLYESAGLAQTRLLLETSDQQRHELRVSPGALRRRECARRGAEPANGASVAERRGPLERNEAPGLKRHAFLSPRTVNESGGCGPLRIVAQYIRHDRK